MFGIACCAAARIAIWRGCDVKRLLVLRSARRTNPEQPAPGICDGPRPMVPDGRFLRYGRFASASECSQSVPVVMSTKLFDKTRSTESRFRLLNNIAAPRAVTRV